MFYIIGALFAIVIGVILLVNVMGAGSGASANAEVAETMNEVNQIRAGAKEMGYNNNFYSIDNGVMEQAGAMPPELIVGAIGAGSDIDVWGGAVGVVPWNNCFWVSFASVPQTACIALLSQEYSNCPAAGGSAYLANTSTWHGMVGQPLDPAAAAGACQAGANTPGFFFND